MPLNASGKLSVGGIVTGESIELELGMSGTAVASLNDDNFRALANVSSGTISIDTFHGRQSTWAKRTNSFAGSLWWSDVSVSSTGKYIIMVSNDGWVVVSTDYGRTWSTQSDNTSGVSFYKCYVTDDGNWIYMLGSVDNTRRLWRNTYSGYITLGLYSDVYTFSTLAIGFAAAKNYTPYPALFVSTDFSGAWGSERSYVYKSTDNGATWSTIYNVSSIVTGNRFINATCSDDGNRIAVSNFNGSVYHYTTNGGSSWSTASTTGANFWGIKTDSSGSKIIMSGDDGLWYSSFGSAAGNFDGNQVSHNQSFTLSRDGSTIYAGYPGLSSIKKATSFSQYGAGWSNVYYPSSTGYGIVGCSANGSFVVATAGQNNGAIYTSV